MSAVPVPQPPRDLEHINALLSGLDAEARVAWALENVPGEHVLSSSFGAQAAVSLHMVSRQRPRIPVVLIDTGYLFPETYRFVDELTARLRLNLKVYRARISPAWMEARHGRLWEQGVEGIDRYNQMRKVEPMQRALAELGAVGWFAGLRRSQARTRAGVGFADYRGGRWKFHPLEVEAHVAVAPVGQRVGLYLKRHGLPYHPLWDQGYTSIGDVHTSHRWEPGMDPDDTRFFGLTRECGLHNIG